MPFARRDLEELDRLLYGVADRVVPMRDVFKGDIGHRVVGLRHDVDDNPGSFDTALAMAEWEMENGYSSTFFLLHDSHYWDRVDESGAFEDLGHEVGIHVNAIAEAFRQKRDPVEILRDALDVIRLFARVDGCVAHGDPLCYESRDHLRFVNDELFLESPRPEIGPARRTITIGTTAVILEPVSRVELGLVYDSNWLRRNQYLSDSGGRWNQPVVETAESFGQGQLHMLVHPDHWAEAFASVPETA